MSREGEELSDCPVTISVSYDIDQLWWEKLGKPLSAEQLAEMEEEIEKLAEKFGEECQRVVSHYDALARANLGNVIPFGRSKPGAAS